MYDHDPSKAQDDISKPLISVNVEKNTAWFITDISDNKNCSHQQILFDRVCLGYWAAYIRGDSGTVYVKITVTKTTYTFLH